MDEGRRDMTDAPEKLWVEPDGETLIFHNGSSDLEELIATGCLHEYTRTDMAQARIKELEAALAWYKEQVYFFANGTTVRANEAAIVLEEDGGKKAFAALKGEET
jgi:hypothetical protein